MIFPRSDVPRTSVVTVLLWPDVNEQQREEEWEEEEQEEQEQEQEQESEARAG